jgi:hypothetical protein
VRRGMFQGPQGGRAFIGARVEWPGGAPGRGGRGNGGVNGFNAIEGGARLSGGIKGE